MHSKSAAGEFSRTLLERLFQQMGDPLFVLDEQGTVLWINQAAQGALGYSLSELQGGSVSRVLCCDHATRTALLKSKRGDLLQAEPGITKGEWLGRPAVFTICRSPGANQTSMLKTPTVKTANTQDIDLEVLQKIERYRDAVEVAQEAYRDSEAKRHTLLENSPDFVFVLNRDFTISYVNRVATGQHPDEVLGKKVLDFVPENFHGELLQAMATVLQKRELCSLETEAELPDGKHNFLVRLAPFTGEGHRDSVLMISADITATKKSESALRHALAAVGAASKAKSAFLANISHELRTPINGIVGMNGLLLDTDLSAEQSEYVDIIHSSAESLLSIITDLLDFAQLDQGTLAQDVLSFDLRLALEDIYDRLLLKASNKGLKVSFQIDPRVPSALQGDPGRLRQVLTNLVDNACKFTERGSVDLMVDLEQEHLPRIAVRFSIRDTGIGVSKEQQATVFHAFEQGDGSSTRRFGGTGIGLAIAKMLVEQMGGRIGVESEPDKGSTFWFTAVFGVQPNTDPAAQPAVDIAGTRVLVLEPDPANVRVLQTMLAVWDCHLEDVDSVGALQQKLYLAVDQKKAFDAVIIPQDVVDGDVERIGQLVKGDDKLVHTALIMVTAYGRRGDVARLQNSGYGAYLLQPLKHSQLRDCLEAIAQQKLAAEPGGIITRHTIAEAKKKNFRILVVEDNVPNQKVALSIIEKIGYRADAVGNGSEAITALEMIPYHLVFMDCQMPVMDGFEAARAIRGRESRVKNHRVPIIALTGNALEEDRESCLSAGMNDYLAKPVGPDAVVAMIDKWLVKKGAQTVEMKVPLSQETEVFDKTHLLRRLMGDEELAVEILNGFLSDIPEQLVELEQALDKDDATRVETQAHAIKGAAGTVGALKLQQTALLIEMAGKEGDLTGVRDLCQRLSVGVGELREHLHRIELV